MEDIKNRYSIHGGAKVGIILVSFLLLLSLIARADENIVDFDENSVPVLNDELRKIADDIESLEDDVNNISTTTGPSDMEDDDFGDFTCASGVCTIDLLKGYDLSELTISGGVITVTNSIHKVDTEADAASDDLDTINGGVNGQILILRTADSTRDVVVKDGTGNLYMAGDFTLSSLRDRIMFVNLGSSTWDEISRSDNN